MNKFFAISISVAALLIFSSSALAQGSPPNKAKVFSHRVETPPHVAKKTLDKQPKAGKCKSVAKTAAKPSPPAVHRKVQQSGVKAKYNKTAVPWYYNPLVAWVGALLLICLGAIIGRISRLIPCRPKKAKGKTKPKLADKEDWLKRDWGSIKKFFGRFRKTDISHPEPV